MQRGLGYRYRVDGLDNARTPCGFGVADYDRDALRFAGALAHGDLAGQFPRSALSGAGVRYERAEPTVAGCRTWDRQINENLP